MAIRYDKQFNAEIARVVKNFNAKVMRLSSEARVLAPKTVLVSELKQQYDNRNELKRRLKELQIFSQKGMEEEVVIGDTSTTKYEQFIEKRHAAVAKRNLTIEIRKAERSPKTANTAYINNLRKRREILDRPFQSLSPALQRAYRKTINTEYNKRKKQEMFYNNMFKMVYRTAYLVGMDSKDVEKALSVFRKLTPAQLADALDTMPTMNVFTLKYSAIDAISDEGQQDVASALNNLVDSFSSVYNFYNG